MQTGSENIPYHTGHEDHDDRIREEEEEGKQAEPAASPEAKGEPEHAHKPQEPRQGDDGKSPSEADKVRSLLLTDVQVRSRLACAIVFCCCG